MRYATRNLVVLVFSAFVAACGNDTTQPTAAAGTLGVRLASPLGAEGAALIELRGPVHAVSATGGQLYELDEDGVRRVLVIMDEAGPISFAIEVPDTSDPPEYEILQVSAPDDELRADLTGYTLEFVQ